MESIVVAGATSAHQPTQVIALSTLPASTTAQQNWDSMEIAATDATFTQDSPSLLHTAIVSSACLALWKELTFESVNRKNTREEDKELAE